MSNLTVYNPNPKTPYAEREPNDFYPTPLDLCKKAVNLIPVLGGPRIVDPGAGTGVWGIAARQRWPHSFIAGYEIREDAPRPEVYDLWERTDFRLVYQPCEVVIGNPPYKYAEQFVRNSMVSLRDGGYCLFLLRLAFLEGQDRGKGFWREYPPYEVHVLSRRPSFMPRGHPKAGKTDATAYALYLWQKGLYGPTRLSWFDW